MINSCKVCSPSHSPPLNSPSQCGLQKVYAVEKPEWKVVIETLIQRKFEIKTKWITVGDPGSDRAENTRLFLGCPWEEAEDSFRFLDSLPVTQPMTPFGPEWPQKNLTLLAECSEIVLLVLSCALDLRNRLSSLSKSLNTSLCLFTHRLCNARRACILAC
jgi:hypothetical protein